MRYSLMVETGGLLVITEVLCITLHHITLLHYITTHYNTLQYTIHYITIHNITLQYLNSLNGEQGNLSKSTWVSPGEERRRMMTYQIYSTQSSTSTSLPPRDTQPLGVLDEGVSFISLIKNKHLFVQKSFNSLFIPHGPQSKLAKIQGKKYNIYSQPLQSTTNSV